MHDFITNDTTTTRTSRVATALSSAVIVSVALSGVSLLSGCNTVAGAGEDVEAVGGELEETAEEAN